MRTTLPGLASLFALALQVPVPVEIGAARQGTDSPALPRCRVFGRALDEQGQSIVGAEVRLRTVGEAWRAGASGPDGKSLPGSYATVTSEDGRFSIEAPLPTSSWVSMIIEPGPYQAQVGRDFGLAGGRNEDPLFEGDNDLGDFTLATTGAIAVQVVGPNGAPLPDARVSVDGAAPGGLVLNGFLEESGGFLIGHVPPGSYVLKAVCDGYQSARSATIEVARLRTSTAPEIALAAALAIAGRVVDEAGRPIEGVQVWGWPVGGGRGAGGSTGPDGRFEVDLPEPVAYRFEFQMEGYRSIKEPGGSPPVTLQPGTTAAVITMIAVHPVTFRVLDARTGRPLESFGMRVDPRPDPGHSSSRDREPIPSLPAPGGERQAFAEARRQVVRVMADGFAPATHRVAFDPGEENLQTIRLLPAGRVVGTIYQGGAPVDRATVRLERTRVKLDPSWPDEFGDERFFSDNYGWDLDEFTGRLRLVTTSTDGRFALEDLAAGTYQWTVSAEVGAPLELDGLVVAEGETVDLGRLELPSAAAVAGRVLGPASVSVAGLEVFLGDPFDGVVARVAANGSFRFDGLVAGDQALTIAPTPGILAREFVTRFTAEAGATREVTLDLRPLQPVRVRLVVELNDQRLEGLSIQHGRRLTPVLHLAGRTDSNGALTFEVEPGPDLQLAIESPLGMRLGAVEIHHALVAGTELEPFARLDAGHWAVEFPPDFVLPAQGRASLQIMGSSAEPSDRRLLFLGTPDLEFPTPVVWREPRCELGPIAPGSYTVVVHVHEYGESNGIRAFIPYGEPLTAPLEVRAGEQATARLLPKE